MSPGIHAKFSHLKLTSLRTVVQKSLEDHSFKKVCK